jgi:hypothetical protein
MMASPRDEPAMVCVFDDRRCLGHLLRRGPKDWEVFDGHDVSLGAYPSKSEAAAALTLGIRGNPQ